MSNNALVSHWSYAGTYKISTDVNGKPSYILDENAIWFYPDYNLWFIGPISDIGKFGLMGAYDEGGGLTDDKNIWWHENNDEVNDISVQCTITPQGMSCPLKVTLFIKN